MLSVIIPVYKNTPLFLKNLAHNLKFLKNVEIIVVNDDPQTNITKGVHKLDKHIKVIHNSQNLGFGASMNQGSALAKGDYLLFLNSDVRLIDDSYQKAVKEFADPKLFALSFQQLEKNDELSLPNQGQFEGGLFQHSTKTDAGVTPTLWAEGGSCLLSRQVFNELGGFDPLYSPFYWEDIDLGYRAWKMGYKILFYPPVVVRHEHSTTINKYFSKDAVEQINYRNQFLFVWKNMRGGNLLKHCLYLPLLLLRQRKNPLFFAGFVAALNRYFRQR